MTSLILHVCGLSEQCSTTPSISSVFLRFSNQSTLCFIALLQKASMWLWQSIILCSVTLHSVSQPYIPVRRESEPTDSRLMFPQSSYCHCGSVALEFHQSTPTGISNGILMGNILQKYPLARMVYILQISPTFFISFSRYERDFAAWAYFSLLFFFFFSCSRERLI